MTLDGANALVGNWTDALSNDGLTELSTIDVGDKLNLENGAAVFTDQQLSNSGTVNLDAAAFSGNGGSNLTVGGEYFNAGVTNIGSGSITLADFMSVGSLDNTGAIDIQGGAGGADASMTVNSAAGTGTTGVLTGTVSLSGDAQLEFASGQINTLDGNLTLSGSQASVGILGTTFVNGALGGLSQIDSGKTIDLESGAVLDTNIGNALTNSGKIVLDASGAGQSILNVGGLLTNDGEIDIGGAGTTTADTVQANSLTNAGTIDLIGNSTGGGGVANLWSNGAASNAGTIEGVGIFDMLGATGVLTNEAGAKIDANVSGGLMTLDKWQQVINYGTLEADGGTLKVNASVTGTGSAAITNGGTLEFSDSFNENVAFLDPGKLVLSQNIETTPYTGVISGFGLNNGAGDSIDLTGVAYDANAIAKLNQSDVLTVSDNGTVLYTLDFNSSVAGDTFHLASIDGGTGTEITCTPCYCAGTLILTDRGDVAVETLEVGDRVMTIGGESRAIKWMGTRSFDGRFVGGNRDVLPICIRAGALAEKTPSRDLWVSPHHAIYLEGVLIEAKDLVNDVTIVQAERVERVDYFHVELFSHDVIFAEGAAAETFVDNDSRAMFQNVDDFFALYPDEVAVGRSPRPFAPRLDEGREVETAWLAIAARAGILAEPASILAGPASILAEPASPGEMRGWVEGVTSDALWGWAQDAGAPDAPVCLHVLADGYVIGRVLANRFRADLKEAGIGRGRHAFRFAPPKGVDLAKAQIELRHAADGRRLAGTDQRAA